MPTRCLILIALCCWGLAAAEDRELAFLEAYTLGQDRDAAFEQLIPGSELDYFYRCLHHQERGELDAVDQLLERWQEARVGIRGMERIRDRQAVLRYAADPAQLPPLIERLGLTFDHRPTLLDAEAVARLPTELAADLSWRRLREQVGAHRVDALDPAQRRRLVSELASGEPRWRALLAVLEHPDIPGFVAKASGDLDDYPFGTRPWHAALTLDQLDALAQRRGELRADQGYALAVLRRIAPPLSDDEAADPAVARDRITAWETAIVDRRLELAGWRELLRPLRMRLDLELGEPSLTDLVADLDQRAQRWSGEFREVIGIDPLTERERHTLHERLLDHHLGTDPVAARVALAEVLPTAELERRALVAALYHGGDEDRIAAADPVLVAELRQRQRLMLAPGAPRILDLVTPAVLPLRLARIDELTVEVTRIDEAAWLRDRDQALSAEVELGGMEPNTSRRVAVDAEALHWSDHRLTLPECDRPGSYLVAVIAGDRQLRAMIRRGVLRIDDRATADGHLLRVRAPGGGPAADAVAWLGGNAYRADADGHITLPFAAEAVHREAVIAAGPLASRYAFTHATASYRCRAQLLYNPEQARPGATLDAAVQALVQLGDDAVDPALIGDAELVLRWHTDAAPIIRSLPLAAPTGARDQELRFVVPESARNGRWFVHVTMTDGRRLSTEGPIALQGDPKDGDVIADAFLQADGAHGHHILLMGRNGEALSGVACDVTVRAEPWNPIERRLASDARGTIDLGGLPSCEVAITAVGGGLPARNWRITAPVPELPSALHLAAGEALRLALPLGCPTDRHHWSLLRVHGSDPVADRFDALRFEPGGLSAPDLAPGRYRLRYHDGRSMDTAITVHRAQRRNDILEDALVTAPAAELDPLRLRAIEADADAITIRLAGAGAGTRVHVAASQLRTTGGLAPFVAAPAAEWVRHRRAAHCEVLAATTLDEEERYIRLRRDAEARPGVMLDRPGLALIPRPIEADGEFDDGDRSAGSFGSRSGGGKKRAVGHYGGSEASERDTHNQGTMMLADGAPLLRNLIPDAAGVVRIPRADLAGRHHLRIAVVDPRAVLIHDQALAAPRQPQLRDRRTTFALDAAVPWRLERTARGLGDGESWTAPGPGRAASFTGWDQVHGYLRTLVDDPRFDRFAILAEWDRLDDAAKHRVYGELACHELHLFLHRRDPGFFATVVRPFIAQRLQPDLLDHLLLGRDLEPWLTPAALAQMNHVERCLVARAVGAPRAEVIDALTMARNPPAPTWDHELLRNGLLHRNGRALGGGGFDLFGFGHRGDDRAPALEQPMEEVVAEAVVEVEGPIIPMVLDTFVAEPELLIDNRWDGIDARRPAIDDAPLWADLAHGGAFRSPSLAAADDHNEALATLALVDLPLRAPAPADDGAVHGPAILIAESLVRSGEAAPVPGLELAVAIESGWDPRDPAAPVVRPGIRVTLTVALTLPEDALGAGVAYDLVVALPNGCVGLDGEDPIMVTACEAWEGEVTVDRTFYFPEAGTYPQLRAVLCGPDGLIAAAPATTWTVRDAEPDEPDAWKLLAAKGGLEAVIEALAPARLDSGADDPVDLDDLLWRLRDPAAYARIRDHLATVAWSDHGVAAYAFAHGDAPGIRSYLRDHAALDLGPAFRSSLVVRDELDDLARMHLDLAPLIHARSHRHDPTDVPSSDLAHLWRTQLRYVAHKPAADDRDRLIAALLLSLQDRAPKALTLLDAVAADALPQRLQRDYLRAWLALAHGDAATASAIAERYAEHPVPLWRTRFAAVLAHLGGGRGAEGFVPASAIAGGDETTITLTPQARALRIQIAGAAVERCEIELHPIDLERRFSRQPFSREADQRPVIAPRHRIELPVVDGAARWDFPDDFAATALVVVRAGDGVAVTRISGHRLDLHLSPRRGELLLLDRRDETPLPAAYVKVYAIDQADRVRFHKDGYTDLRGRFDYVTLSQAWPEVKRFALLVVHAEAGATTVEVDPPPR